ncbi:hypothetical protein L2E82_37305 [Cichorium intybus]|uniref:Uncharacterized protein n=1 Tax=Cichorium intybus TaxID=13427 RepID=A0ACB9AEW3_CICIN|nr:hypothetical protein L2E82_37305 [Cichorium intybus]
MEGVERRYDGDGGAVWLAAKCDVATILLSFLITNLYADLVPEPFIVTLQFLVSASCSVGEAIEQIRIHKFLEKTKTRTAAKAAKSEEKVSHDVITEQEGLHKKVTNLMKKGKLQVVGHIVFHLV